MAVERSKIAELIEAGHPRAGSVERALKTLSFQLSGAQLGITISSLALGFIIDGSLGELFRPLLRVVMPDAAVQGASLTLALAVATVTQMVAGELMPKNLAIARPLSSALWVASPLRAANALFKPLIVLLNQSANVTVKLLGIQPQEELASVRSLDELQLLIESSREQGSLPEEHASLLARSISFGDKTAGDALMPRTSVHALPRTATVGDLQQLSLETGHSRFPVYDGDLDDVLGIANIKEAFRIPFEERAEADIALVTRDALVVPEMRSLDSLLHEIRREGNHLVLVVDEYGGTSGIVTLEDLMEEIVGEIEDEYDPAGAPRPSPPEGSYLLEGMLHPSDVHERCGFRIPEGDYDTLAGFLLSLFDRIPEQGDHVSYEGWEFKVVGMERNRIAEVLVVAPAHLPEEEQP